MERIKLNRRNRLSCIPIVALAVLVFGHHLSDKVYGREVTHGNFTSKSPVIDRNAMQRFFKNKAIAGNVGDYYLNLDGGHSVINLKNHPQVGTALSNNLLSSGEEYSRYNHVIIGNASLGTVNDSRGRETRGSLINNYYTPKEESHEHYIGKLYENYRGNVMLVFPAVACYGPGINGTPGYGDYFPANTPYVVGTAGASGSDKSFLTAWTYMLASFHPRVKAKLKEEGLLMPTTQMIFRMSNSNIGDPAEYLTGKAHPPAFYGGHINALKMCKIAVGMTTENLPPLVQLDVLEEDQPVPGIEFYDPRFPSDKIFDSPGAIARTLRGYKQKKKLVVSANYSFDVNERPLSYHWVVLRGDKTKVRITPRDEDQSIAEIEVSYFERYKDPDYNLYTNRVEIGVFVNNGSYFSAPGFITFYSFANEIRTYNADGRIVEIGYNIGDSQIECDIDSTGGNFNISNGRYDIKDWPALLNFVSNGPSDSLPARLIQANMDNNFQEVIKERSELLHACFDRIKMAKEDPSLGKDTVNAAKKEAYNILYNKDLSEKFSIKELMERTLNDIKSDVKLYQDNQTEIDQIIEKEIKKKAKSGLVKERQRLMQLGILNKSDSGTYAIQSVREGSSPLEDRLTKYERNQLERFNIILMNTVLYPKFMNKRLKINATDVRLSTPKSWYRDVYHHDKIGVLSGWSRYDEGGITRYDHTGALVNGKNVNYKVERPNRSNRGNWYDIQVVPAVTE